MLLLEDDYLMIEIMSSKNLAFAKELIEETESKTEQIKTEELHISKKELSDLLKNAKLNEYENISYLWNGKLETRKDTKTRAFGSLENAIFFDGATDTVEHIWLSLNNWKEIARTHILDGLHSIGNKYDMILVDTYPIQNKIVNLKKKKEIKQYLELYIDFRKEAENEGT